MIFVSVGAEKFPFDRLLKSLNEAVKLGAITEPIIAQSGYSSVDYDSLELEPFMSFQSVVEHMQAARIVISHAGVGTTLLALKLGKTPVLFPRRKAFQEHFDDHQMQFIQRISTQQKVLVAMDTVALIETLQNFDQRVADLEQMYSERTHQGGLAQHLKNYYGTKLEARPMMEQVF